MAMAKYNTMVDVGFTIDHDLDNTDDIPVGDMIDALQYRIEYLRNNPNEAREAFGICDTYQN